MTLPGPRPVLLGIPASPLVSVFPNSCRVALYLSSPEMPPSATTFQGSVWYFLVPAAESSHVLGEVSADTDVDEASERPGGSECQT